MSLPRSVQEQVNRSNEHFEKPVNPEEETSTHEGERNPPKDQDDTVPPPEGDTAGQSADTESPKGGQKSQEQAKQEPDKDALYWQHRFKVIEGKYNAEVPALQKEVADLKRDNEAKAERIKELESQQGSTGQAGDLSDEKLAQFREDFGEDLVDFVERMIAQKAAPSQAESDDVSELRSEVESLKQEKLDHAKAGFWRDLQWAVPNFREVNADPGFLQYLAQVDPQSGRQRQQLLDEAQKALDAKTVIDIFQLYLNQAGQGAERSTRVPEEELEPPRSRSTDTPPAGGGNVWTGAGINQFYRDKREGRYSADEAQRLEADIFAAQKEGRVQP
ncbi:hypothetical protein [Halomonas sp. NO4]|uniref:hypothetical protein n=1 Tax=Halomonas sp. NO4 TaxID=2484813 RepID=UPI0013D02A08|nr:hypothetical protein [Halomonas sp. NO4]